MDIESNELETKAGIPAAAPGDAAVTHSEMMRAFESFKEAARNWASARKSLPIEQRYTARI